ncbi:MAG: hypothetical protein A2Y91_04950 [Chloroflexi bacterium RBG_13_54_8]|nr:MAG: hypothetical protein A2Y91_04950 [Chloroflexi bacterium RBG_13_54_8]
MRVGIIGAGLQARRRAPVLLDSPDTKLVVISAAHPEPAKRLAEEMGCEADVGWERIVNRNDIDTIIVCTPPHIHAAVSIAAIKSGKHVLCEKPLTRTLAEAEEMVKVAQKCNVTLKCGFNHRHHPGIQKVRQWLDKGLLGKPLVVRCRYGIGGRPGYEKEWRANPEVVGGGQLMEQGIHGIDLARWFLGEFSEASGIVETIYWPIKPLEDNAFAIYRTKSGGMAFIHSSLTQWKNLFSFELYGTEGYAAVEGLGGGYGNERAILAKKDFFAPFQEETTEFRGDDRSWREEWKEFVTSVRECRDPVGSGKDGLEAMRLVMAVYQAAKTGQMVKL